MNRGILEPEAVTPSEVYLIGDPWSVRNVRIVNCHSAILRRSITYFCELPEEVVGKVLILIEEIGTASVKIKPGFVEVVLGVILEVISPSIIVPIVRKYLRPSLVWFVLCEPEVCDVTAVPSKVNVG